MWHESCDGVALHYIKCCPYQVMFTWHHVSVLTESSVTSANESHKGTSATVGKIGKLLIKKLNGKLEMINSYEMLSWLILNTCTLIILQTHVLFKISWYFLRDSSMMTPVSPIYIYFKIIIRDWHCKLAIG